MAATEIAWKAEGLAVPANDPIDADIKQWEEDQQLLNADIAALKDLLASIKNGTCKLSPIELIAVMMHDLTNIITDKTNMNGDMVKVTADLTNDVSKITKDITNKDATSLVKDVNKFQADIKQLHDDKALDDNTYKQMSDAIQKLNAQTGNPFNNADGTPGPGSDDKTLQSLLNDPQNLSIFTTMTGVLNTNATSISSQAQTMFKYDTDVQGQELTAMTNVFKSWSGQARSFVQNQKTN